VDLKGKAGHTRTIRMPAWVKNVGDRITGDLPEMSVVTRVI